jgi:hypothetical protein
MLLLGVVPMQTFVRYSSQLKQCLFHRFPQIVNTTNNLLILTTDSCVGLFEFCNTVYVTILRNVNHNVM